MDEDDRGPWWPWLAGGALLGVVAAVLIARRRRAAAGGAHPGPDEDQDDDETREPMDESLDARVLEAFEHDPVLAHRAIEIDEARPGRIVLRGRVRAPAEIRHAVTIARGVPGVAAVRERLTVREGSR